jgi:hypothetical protein
MLENPKVPHRPPRTGCAGNSQVRLLRTTGCPTRFTDTSLTIRDFQDGFQQIKHSRQIVCEVVVVAPRGCLEGAWPA